MVINNNVLLKVWLIDILLTLLARLIDMRAEAINHHQQHTNPSHKHHHQPTPLDMSTIKPGEETENSDAGWIDIATVKYHTVTKPPQYLILESMH